jgi:hypothetical protein
MGRRSGAAPSGWASYCRAARASKLSALGIGSSWCARSVFERSAVKCQDVRHILVAHLAHRCSLSFQNRPAFHPSPGRGRQGHPDRETAPAPHLTFQGYSATQADDEFPHQGESETRPPSQPGR